MIDRLSSVLTVTALLAIAAMSQPCRAQSLPVPEYYGVYVVSEGHLLKLDATPFHPDRSVTVGLGYRNSVGNIVNGQPAALPPTSVSIPVFPANLKIIIYSESPTQIASSLHLVPMVFVKSLSVDTGMPPNIKRTDAENGWDDGSPAELVMANLGEQVQEVNLLTKPMPGQSQMVIVGLAEKLPPGVYRIRQGEDDPIAQSMASWTGGTTKGMAFAVEPVSKGEEDKCVNESLSYMMTLSKTAYTPCGASSGNGGGNGSRGPSRDAGGSPTKSAESGSTLAATMQFIKEELNQQGRVSWTEIKSNQPGVAYRTFDTIDNAKADLAACTLTTTETVDTSVVTPFGNTLSGGDKPAATNDLRSHIVETGTTPFKQVEKVIVEKVQESRNKVLASTEHPEITATVTPTVFYVMLSASSPVFTAHTATTKGNQATTERDATFRTNGLAFRDEDTANHVAKAMIHAIELCGGTTEKDDF
jgi:hypothetical protein